MLEDITKIDLFIRDLKRKLCIFSAVIVLLLLAAFTMWKEMVVTLVVSGEETVTVYSFTENPDLILGRSCVEVNKEDTVIFDYFDAQVRESIIIVTKPRDVSIYDDGKLYKVVTVSGTIGDAIEKSGIKLKEGDKLSLGKKVPITEEIKVDIDRAFTVTVICDGRKQKIKTTDCTVKDLLSKAGIVLGDEDIVSPKLSKKLTQNTKVQVKRVTYKDSKKTVDIEYETVVKYDDSMYEEQVYVKRKGQNGKKVKYYKNKYIDGKYVSKKHIKTEITKDPVSKVVVWGSKPSLYGGDVAKRVISDLTPPYKIDMDENNRPIKYKKKIVGKATAYCTGTVTSTGRRAQEGVVAVDPREIPYGSKLYIVSSDNRYVYGYAIAGDTGGFIYNSDTVVDLYISGYSACKRFGRRTVEIYILE